MPASKKRASESSGAASPNERHQRVKRGRSMSPQKPIRMLSRQEEKEMLSLGEELLLTDFPNPERLGCPRTAPLRTLALRSRGLPVSERNRLLGHMICCSPCFSELSA